jgi:hypothetical protein
MSYPRLFRWMLLFTLLLFLGEVSVFTAAQLDAKSQPDDFFAPVKDLMPGEMLFASDDFFSSCHYIHIEEVTCQINQIATPFLSANVSLVNDRIQTLRLGVSGLSLGDLTSLWGKSKAGHLSATRWLIIWGENRYAYATGTYFSYFMPVGTLVFTG